jgi:hypothetical protein
LYATPRFPNNCFSSKESSISINNSVPRQGKEKKDMSMKKEDEWGIQSELPF